MANSTGQNLVDLAREVSGYQVSQAVTDAEVLVYVNEHTKKLYDLINEQDESVYSTPYLFSLPDPVLQTAYTAASLGTAPVNFAALPDDCDRIQGLDYQPAAPRPITVHPFTFVNRNDGWFLYKAMGRIAGKEILQVIPAATSAGPYQLWYIQQFVPLTLITALDNNMQRYQPYIYYGAGIDILDKVKRDSSQLTRKQQAEAKRVATMAQNRDSGAEQGGTEGGNRDSNWPYFSGPRLF